MNSQHFTEQLSEALKHFHEPHWLGEHSPLSWPYFLGSWLEQSKPSAQALAQVEPTALRPALLGNKTSTIANEARGKALQQLLVQANQEIRGKDAIETEELQTLLRRTYFEPEAPTQEALSEQLGLSLATYKRQRNKALNALGESLVALVQPALRLECAPNMHSPLERTTLLANCLQRLHNRETVLLQGSSGIGKTAVGVELTNQWIAARQSPIQQLSATKSFAFWYTIRPELNDQIENFVFALGLFAHQHGVSVLWQELVSSQGQAAAATRRAKLLAMVNYVLHELRPLPLLVIDEVDLLRANTSHASLIQLIESLRSSVPILLIGQQSEFVADYVATLPGISLQAQQRLLSQYRIQLSATQRAQLNELTGGNPRLLHLFCNVHQSGLTADEVLAHLVENPTLAALFQRLLQRLSDDERNLLQQLAVFPAPVPLDHWLATQQSAGLDQLRQRQLLQVDPDGGVEIPQIYRQLVYSTLDEAARRQFQRRAAVLRQQSGAYTAAAYHWLAANEPYQALQDWEEHQTQEIAQGQAATALQLFQRLQTTPLPSALAERTRLLCAKLEHLTGQPTVALAAIQPLLAKESLTAIEANELAGKIHNDRGETEEAERRFHRSLRLGESMLEVRSALARKGLAWAYLNEVEIERAEHEINLAAYEVEQMRGNLARERCRYEVAVSYYQNALQLAEETSHHEGIGKTCNSIAGILMRQGSFDNSFHYLARAYQIFEKIGKTRYVAGCCISRAVAYNLAEQPELALQSIHQGHQLLHYLVSPETSLQIPLLLAEAEAYLGLDQLEQACATAYAVNQLEDKRNSRDAAWVLGEAHSRRKQWQQAKSFLSDCIKQCESDPYNIDLYLSGYANRSLALHFKRQGQTMQIHEPLTRAIALFESIKLPFEIARTHRLLETTVPLN